MRPSCVDAVSLALDGKKNKKSLNWAPDCVLLEKERIVQGWKYWNEAVVVALIRWNQTECVSKHIWWPTLDPRTLFEGCICNFTLLDL